MEKELLWKTTLETLKIVVSEANFATWFPQTFIERVKIIDNDHLIVEIGCPSSFVRDAVENRYYGMIKEVLDKQTEKKCDLLFLVKQKEIKKEEREEKEPLFKQRGLVWRGAQQQSNLNPNFTFSKLVVGNTNSLAHAAAKGIVANPGKAYNPFFIYGGVGVGKTHLMQAIGHAILAKNEDFKVIYVSAETFTNDLISSLQDKSTTKFKNKYRSAEVLLIDDIQFIAGKEYIQEEFFHTFNALYMAGRQIVMTSDRRPEDLAKVEDRLISRFMGGLTVDVQAPDYEMRMAILGQKSEERGKKLNREVLDFIANQVFSNARELEGMLIQILAKAEAEGKEITLEFIKEFFGLKKERKAGQITPQKVLSETARFFDFKVGQLTGPARKAPLVRARHLAMFILRHDLEIPLVKVGDMFGGRDHTTIMHAVGKIENSLNENELLKQDLTNLRGALYKR